jgi:hypothetical protein
LRRLAVTVLVLALLVGTTTAFALTEVLKLERSPVTRPRFTAVFSPTCACRRETARLAVRLRRADKIDAVILDADGDPVRTLVAGARAAAGRNVFLWNGRSDAGALVPDGAYRLSLHFADAGRTILIPDMIRVDTVPPKAELVSLAPRRISPNGTGAKIVLHLSETARTLVLASGELVFRGETRDAGTVTLVWDGTARGRPLSPGRYVVTLEARDPGGNLSPPTEGISVRVLRPA